MSLRARKIRAETAAVLESLRGVWDEEVVDEWDHAMQAAACAIEDGADDELVLAAALHDIGHSPLLGGPHVHDHSGLARDWITPRFGPRVGWLAGAHVSAKRHLAAVDPAYTAALSPTSVASLAAQGGAHVDPEFAEHPWCADALRLRRYDDAAKDPDAVGASADLVLDLAQKLAR
ncbi:HD family phosphohydrolase [Mycolicibacterium austroafricanum]|uniref:HD family phosphohydrolase n=1 Tax=Mycolicibacterium austroafricanum TaxID=39687 RepID=UPI001CA3504E|nr:HD family phosphohydrolase [Mycolicibacterium austroafricanum]QZT62944.1 HD family phosphohydrolase [Mycolicibacterium austroafricanum]